MKIDLISRQGAIKAIENCTGIYVNNLPTMINKTDAYKVLTDLPSAQPEIIRCRDCIHTHDHDCPVNWGRTEDDYCSWAER